MDNRSAEALIFWIFTTAGALLLTWLILRSRAAAGIKLIVLGIVVALVALWYGFLMSLPNNQGLPMPMGNPALGEIMLRLAAVLVLGGVVMTLLVHDTATVSYFPPEPPHNVPPSI